MFFFNLKKQLLTHLRSPIPSPVMASLTKFLFCDSFLIFLGNEVVLVFKNLGDYPLSQLVSLLTYFTHLSEVIFRNVTCFTENGIVFVSFESINSKQQVQTLFQRLLSS